jgi:hypothetical protein
MADFDPKEFLDLPEIAPRKVVPGIGARAKEPAEPTPSKKGDPSPSGETAPPAAGPAKKTESAKQPSWLAQAATDAAESFKAGVKHFGVGTARGFLSGLTAAGQDISSGLPMGVLDPALGDVALQETRRRAGEAVKGWTPPPDPQHSFSEGAGELAGETVVPSALARFIPGGKFTEKMITKGAEKVLPDLTKGMPYALPGKGGKFVPNPARKAAKEAMEERMGKVGKVAERAGGAVRNVERGAAAGAMQPTEDRGEALKIGGYTAGAMTAANEVMKLMSPEVRVGIDIAAAAGLVEFLHSAKGYDYGTAAMHSIPFLTYFAFHEARHARIGQKAVGALGSPLLQAETAGAAGRLGGGERESR